jgi:hypothetical protein
MQRDKKGKRTPDRSTFGMLEKQCGYQYGCSRRIGSESSRRGGQEGNRRPDNLGPFRL